MKRNLRFPELFLAVGRLMVQNLLGWASIAQHALNFGWRGVETLEWFHLKWTWNWNVLKGFEFFEIDQKEVLIKVSSRNSQQHNCSCSHKCPIWFMILFSFKLVENCFFCFFFYFMISLQYSKNDIHIIIIDNKNKCVLKHFFFVYLISRDKQKSKPKNTKKYFSLNFSFYFLLEKF